MTTHAVVCTSEDSENKLQLTSLGSQLVTGQMLNTTLNQVYVGKTESNLRYTTYELFNQDGIPATFTIKNNFIISGGHCRARVCPGDLPQDPTKKGKLIIEGKADEYFSCL